MEYNVYDFDGTLYKGDVSKDFYCFAIRRVPKALIELPRFLLYSTFYQLGIISKKTLKECFFRFLRHVPSIEEIVREFWKSHQSKIKRFYYAIKTEQDIIISASPDFLLNPLEDLLGVVKAIATKVDKYTGKLWSENCYGEEKVRRFLKEFPDAAIRYFYSDNRSDQPLCLLAKKSYFVRGNRIIPWKNASNENCRGLMRDG